MIINIRGTSGAGKSTLVRQLAQYYDIHERVYVDGRTQPISYFWHKPGYRSAVILGHYETACGGCDTIKTVDEVYELVRGYAPAYDILYEGIMVQDDVRRCVELNATRPVLVISLTTPIDVCIAGIQARRDARGDTRPLDPTNTRNRAARQVKIAAKLRAAGVEVLSLGRAEALAECLRRLNLNPPATALEGVR